MILPEDHPEHQNQNESYQPISTSSEFVLDDEDDVDDESALNGISANGHVHKGGDESQDISDQEYSEDGRSTPPIKTNQTNQNNKYLINGYNTLKSPKSSTKFNIGIVGVGGGNKKKTNSYHLSISPTHSHLNKHLNGHLNGSPDLTELDNDNDNGNDIDNERMKPSKRPSSADRKFSRTPLLPSHQTDRSNITPPSSSSSSHSRSTDYKNVSNQSQSSADINLPPALHANFITSCIGVTTILLLWPPLIILHYIGWEIFKWPSAENVSSLYMWGELAVVAFGGAIYVSLLVCFSASLLLRFSFF